MLHGQLDGLYYLHRDMALGIASGLRQGHGGLFVPTDDPARPLVWTEEEIGVSVLVAAGGPENGILSIQKLDAFIGQGRAVCVRQLHRYALPGVDSEAGKANPAAADQIREKGPVAVVVPLGSGQNQSLTRDQSVRLPFPRRPVNRLCRHTVPLPCFHRIVLIVQDNSGVVRARSTRPGIGRHLGLARRLGYGGPLIR